MKLKNTRLLILFLLFNLQLSYAQDSFIENRFTDIYAVASPKAFRGGRGFSLDKFSIGIKGGINFSLIIPYQRSSVFTGQPAENLDKNYNLFFENLGTHMGFIIMYDINRFLKLSLQPSSNDYVYKYQTVYFWQGNTNIQYQSDFAHKVRMFEVPLILGLYMTYQTFQPYFQGGIYYGKVVDATTKVSVVETSTNVSGTGSSLDYLTAYNSADLYGKNQFGVLAGAGIAYLAGNTRIGLEANYRLLLTNLNTTETQYMNNQVVSGNYDVPDKFKFSNLAITLNIIVPLVCKNSSSRGGAVFCE